MRGTIRKVTSGRVRLSVFRSSKHIYAQVIDDLKGETLVSASSIEKDLRGGLKTGADIEAAKALSGSPAALDLFMWLSYRCFTARGRETVPLFGEAGLIDQLGIVDYCRPRKFREKLEKWLAVIKAMWPDCPASISKEGSGLVVDQAIAILGGENHPRRN